MRILAPSFPRSKLEEIRSRANIVDIIAEHVTLRKVGRNYKALCPFHAETAPSFSVNEEKQIFYCFGCHKGGDVIAFLKEINQISFVDAVMHLAARYGISLPSVSVGGNDRGEKRDSLLDVNERSAQYFHQILTKHAEGEAGRAYLRKRRIEERVWETFRLGYAPNRWDGLTRHLKVEKSSLALAQELGLIVPKKEGGFYDSFRGRIIFPILDVNGRTIGFGGRAVGGGTPKYLNSSDSLVYKKRSSLFGLPTSKAAVSKEDRVLIVEGYFDLLSLYQFGFCFSVSPLGTALTREHIQTIKRFSKNIIVVFDADEAGAKAAVRSLEVFLDEGVSPKVVALPVGTDPDEFVQRQGAEEFRKRVDSAPFLLDLFIDKAVSAHDVATPQGKAQVVDTVMPMLNRVSQPIVQDEYMRRLADRLGVREERIRSLRKETTASLARNDTLSPEKERNRTESFLLSLLLQRPEMIPFAHKAQVLDSLEDEAVRKVVGAVFGKYAEAGRLDLGALLDELGEPEKNIVIQLSVGEQDFGRISESLKDCICQIKRNQFRKLKACLTRAIKQAEAGHDEVGIRDLHQKKIDLLRQEKDLNKSVGALLSV
jgi:DNA primase